MANPRNRTTTTRWSQVLGKELLMLDVPHLDTANRLAVVTRKGGAKDVVVWQTGTARLLPRMLAGRRSGPVFLTDSNARPSVATLDVDPTTGRARLSYRRAAELFDSHTASIDGGAFTLHQLRHSALTHAAEDGASTPMLMKMSGHTSVRSLDKYARPSAEALPRWRPDRSRRPRTSIAAACRRSPLYCEVPTRPKDFAVRGSNPASWPC
jgi:integrase/recombinase XerC/integrase/recombinase XerD